MNILFLLTILRFFEPENTEQIKVIDFESFRTGFLERRNDTLYVINFWASWCLPCREELPDFEKLDRTFPKKQVRVILVSLDMPDQLEARLIPFLEKNHISAEVLVLDDPDFNSWINEIDSTWGGGIPATLIYNKNNRVFLDRKTNYEEIKEIVNQIVIP